MSYMRPALRLPATGFGNRLLAVATVLAMAAVAMLGHRLLPRADVPLPPVENCRLDQRTCAADLPGGGHVEFALLPRPVPTNEPLTVELAVGGVAPEKVEVDFAGVSMNMGHIRSRLETAGGGRYTGRITLPVCVTGSMAWHATVLLDDGRQLISVPFRFESGHR